MKTRQYYINESNRIIENVIKNYKNREIKIMNSINNADNEEKLNDKNNEIVGLNKIQIIKKIEYDTDGNILSPAIIVI